MADQPVTGTPGNDTLVAVGHDQIYGYGGDDSFIFRANGGGAYGGAGNDTFDMSPPGQAQVHAFGGAGNDTFLIDASDRVAPFGGHLWGGTGNDKFVFRTSPGDSARMTGRLDDFDPSRDTIWVNETQIDLQNLPENVRLVEHQGQPWILIDGRVLYALEGARAVSNDAADNTEEVHFIHWPEKWKNGVPEAADITYEKLTSYFPESEIGQPLSSFRNLGGTGQADELRGDGRDEYIRGADGRDTLHGDDGNDVLEGNERNDVLYGGAGNDSLSGGLDQDVIYAGAGNDLAYGGSGHDIVRGEAGNDTLHGEAGHDLLDGGAGHDLLTGGAGEDVLLGGAGNDTLDGGRDNDLLIGGGGADSLQGGAGNDTLIGGAGGTATMTGGAGRDQFVVTPGSQQIITDFTAGQDRLDLRGLTDEDAPLSDYLQVIARDDQASDLLVTLPDGSTALLQGAGGLTADQLAASVLREGGAFDSAAAIAAQEARIAGKPDLSGAGAHRNPESGGDEHLYTPPEADHPDPAPQPEPGGDTGTHPGTTTPPPGAGPGSGLTAPPPPSSGVTPDPLEDELPPDTGLPDDPPPEQTYASSHGGGGCFVATAAFGGVAHPDVTWLRWLRDTHLVHHAAGRRFIRFYWLVGPVLARYVDANGPSGKASRWLLSGLVRVLKRMV